MLYHRQQRKIRQLPIFDSGLKQVHSTDQSDCSHDSSFTPMKYNRTNPKKQKLQLCKKFMQSGFCPYYSRCKFAHGSHQLRKNNQANLRYKTKQCGTFFLQGHCHYGNRCNFLHQQKSKENVSKASMALSKLQNFGLDFFQKHDECIMGSKLSKILE